MSTFAELIDRVKINIASPDGTVVVRYDADGAVIVLGKECKLRHSEQTLSTTVDKCLVSLSRAHDAAKDRILDRVRDGAAVPERRDGPEAERLERYWAELAAARVEATSPRGFVTMERSQDTVTTRIAPRALTRCDTGDIEAELNGALSEVSQRYSAVVTAAYTREYFNVEIAKLPPFMGLVLFPHPSTMIGADCEREGGFV